MNLEERRERALANIRNLEALTRRSRLVLALFVVVSAGAMVNFLLLPGFPRELRELLGAPPPTWLISLGLILYGFSALVLTLGRIAKGSDASFHGWSHLGYTTAFYFFYFYGEALTGYFWGVFTAGLTILVLENYRVGLYCREGIKREKEAMSRIDRGFRPSEPRG